MTTIMARATTERRNHCGSAAAAAAVVVSPRLLLVALLLAVPSFHSSSSFFLSSAALSSSSSSLGGNVLLSNAQPVDCALEVDGTCQQQKQQDVVGVYTASSDASSTATTGKRIGATLECGVYMAPSTLGEATNMGFYAGTTYKKDDVIQSEIAIPLLFREWGAHKPGFLDGELWDRYIWEGSVAHLDPVSDLNREDSRAVFVPGIGCTINSIMDMNNIDSTAGSHYNTLGLHRSKDVGAGAFCPYHFSNTTATTDIPPGAELFASYGDYWIPSIPGAQITLEPQLQAAEDFLRNEYYPWIQKQGDKLSDDLKEKLWQFTRKDFPLYSQAFTVLPQVPWSDVEQALQDEPTTSYVVKKFIRQQSVRKMDWLHTYGYCQDHIRPAKSTIPQAGWGAFASRHLPKGAVVGYSPLIHMGEHGRDIYWVKYPGSADPINHEEQRRYDLIINYSFGHKNSTVMLTPYGGMVHYINHDKERANVKVQWPDKELVAHKPWWLDRSPAQLKDTTEKIGLSFEYVALRDIAEGEEVFMDYGDEWQAAWDEHVKNWYPVPDSLEYVHKTDWPENYVRTINEDKYPDNLVTICIESYSTLIDGSYVWSPPMVDTTQRVYCRALQRTEVAIDKDGEGEEDSNEDSDNTKLLYKVELDLVEDGKEYKVVVDNVPDTGIFLVDRAFSQDWHLPNVFRHEIMIPDDVLPPAWRNGPPPPPREYDPEDDGASDDDDDDDE